MSVDFAIRNIRERRAFACFYEGYAPKLWGLIVSAELPANESETILVQTFSEAWRHPHRQVVSEKQVFTWMLGLAYGAGLPRGPGLAVFDRL